MTSTQPLPFDRRWEIRRGSGPVFATALHAGHELRPEVAAVSALAEDVRLREEDPLTDVLATVGDHLFVPRASRFEIDLNRPAHEAVYRTPSDAWGLELWRDPLTDLEAHVSLASRARYYELMTSWIEELITAHGHILLLDIHSFNHRPADENGNPGPPSNDPDIDLGLTTADRGRFGDVVGLLWDSLSTIDLGDRTADVRENVRFVDGGHWPEWVYANYGEHVCTITLEYKKIFMDEWTGKADIQTLHRLHTGLRSAVDAARPALL